MSANRLGRDVAPPPPPLPQPAPSCLRASGHPKTSTAALPARPLSCPVPRAHVPALQDCHPAPRDLPVTAAFQPCEAASVRRASHSEQRRWSVTVSSGPPENAGQIRRFVSSPMWAELGHRGHLAVTAFGGCPAWGPTGRPAWSRRPSWVVHTDLPSSSGWGLGTRGPLPRPGQEPATAATHRSATRLLALTWRVPV